MNRVIVENPSLPERFVRQAHQSPEAPAVCTQTEQLTFAALNGRTNQLARLLQKQGVGAETAVAVYLDRSVEMVVALLAVLKAGAAYVPVDPGYPPERIEYMLADAETAVCLTNSQLAHKLPAAAQNKVILLDQSEYILSLLPDDDVMVTVQPENLAYVIYTSGSTGKPKGAMITHRGLANYLDWAVAAYPAQAGGAPVHSSVGFDLTVTSLFVPLLAGQPVHLLLEGDVGNLLGQALTQPGGFGLVKITPAHLLLLNQIVPAEQAATATQSFVIGGEQLTAEQLAFWRKHAPHTRLFNEYGPTETVVGCCVYEIVLEDALTGTVPIGQPIANTQLYVLDEQMQLVPEGEVGELYVGGEGVARGYLKRPSLTAEKFVPDPFSGVPSSRLYRTGDLARCRPDGQFEFLGRIDHQVKIRGYRIELGEIEAVLGQHENVRETAVLVHETAGSKQLIAYLTAEQAPAPQTEGLRDFLALQLPDYMIPARFVWLERMPLTINGKIDRQALPAPASVRPDLPQPYAPPRTTQEETLAEIWAEVLGVNPVGIHDSFFGLGGDSINAIQILVQAKQAGLHFSLADLFNLQTIARLLPQLAQQLEIAEADVTAVPPKPFSLINAADRAKLPPAVEDAYPLSKLQAGMLFHSELEAETTVFHNVTNWQIEGKFEGELLATAVQQLAQRHPVLRTSFDLTSFSEPLQLVWSQVQIPVTLHDLRGLDDAAQTSEIEHSVAQTISEKFDWTQPPLLRFHFFQRSTSSFQMIMAEHHAILDGWSIASLATELFQTYQRLLAGEAVQQEPGLAFWQFVAAEQAILGSDAAQVFWQAALAESSVSTVPRLPLPTAADDLPESATYQTVLPANEVTQLKAVAQQAGVPLKTVLLAAHLKVLGFICGQNDVLSGLVMNGRPEQSGSKRALGLFLNTVPFRQKLAPGSWLDLIQHTFATENEILPHRRFPLAEIQQMHGGQPLFEVPFNYLHYHLFGELAADSQISIVDKQFIGYTNFDLAVEAELHPTDGTLVLRLAYKRSEFGAARIEQMAGYLVRTLAVVAAEPEAAHHQFSLLSVAEQQMLLVDWNATGAAVPHQLIHRWVETVADAMPEKTAVAYQNQQIPYAQLNAKANQLAHYLQANGIGPESVVAVYLNRSPEMVIAALAVLKAGGAYLPLDPTYPTERIRYMLEDAQPAALLTQEEIVASAHSQFTIKLDADWPQIAKHSQENPTSPVTADNAAYIIYTSGSTGRPKGVVVTHRGVPNMAQAHHKEFAIGSESRVLQFAAFGFDASVSEIFVTLTAGATLVLADAEAMLPGSDLAELVERQGVTAVTLPPSALAILNPADFPDLQTVVAAGEACSAEVVARWSPGRRFINGYGPTEGTVCATTAVLTPADTHVHIGRPIDNVQLFVLNEEQQPVPVGTPGELYVGGIGLARGYLNRPALTAERFVPLSVSGNRLSVNGDQLPITDHRLLNTVYRTGDLVRYLPDGNLEFLGRLDHQVKIRGYRIELGEVEAALRRETAVQDALVLARDDAGTGPQLVAYVVGTTMAVADLRDALAQQLPAYMIPTAFVILDVFPLTPNGKIDRHALPEPTAVATTAYVAPRTEVETVIVNVWAEILNLPKVGIHDNFFELGGHSLLATQLVTQLRQTLQITLPLRTLFDAPTAAQLTEAVLQLPNECERVMQVARALLAGVGTVSFATILPRPAAADPLPLSLAQQRLWFLEALSPGTALFNTPLALRLSCVLDETALAQACQALVDRHEGLRTTFTAVSGTPQQIIHNRWPITLETMQVTTDSLDELMQTAVQRPFDLEKGPLLRCHLLQSSSTDHILLLVFHHMVFDGWSAKVVVDELVALYETFAQQRQPTLPDLPIQYADYAIWQREWLAGARLQTQLHYWQAQLAGDLPLLQLPTDKPRPAVKTHRGGVETVLLPPELLGQVLALSQQTETTPFMLLLAAFQVLLHRYTAQEDILVGTPIANRQQPDLAGLIGFFVNTLVLRGQVNGEQTFRQLLAQVRQTALAAYDHADVPFEKLVELLQPERNLSYDPIFQVLFAYQEDGMAELSVPNLTFATMEVDNGIAQFDLTLAVRREGEQLSCSLNYNTDLFVPETIRRMLGHWQRLLAGLLAQPEQPVGQIGMLTSPEWQQMVVDWNDTAVPLPKLRFFHEHVAHWAQQSPETPALCYGSQQMDYATLNSKANQLAHALQSWGVGPESRVGIFLNRSFEMIIVLLAVQKAGGAYVPLDTAYPADRLSYMVADAELALVLTTSALGDKLPVGEDTAVALDKAWPEQIANQPASNPPSSLTPDNLAYVIYTSGSTGRPKGVGVTHRGVVNLGQALRQRLVISPQSRVLQFASFSFDASVAEIVGALQNGATLVLANKEALLMGTSFVSLMQQQTVSVATLPPSALALLNPADFPALQTIVSAGEACSADVVANWSAGRRFVNGYGPTEGTVGAITAVLTPDEPQPVLGRPLPNYQIFLLNPQLQPVPVGVAGEIHIAGLGLARGYLNRPDLTAEKFIANPFSANSNQRMYKTGDLGRYLPDGRIEYLGRIDHQVKIRGFRIEIGEVEAAIRQHAAVRDVLVLAQEGGAGLQLVAYVVGNVDDLGDLRPFLNQSLPAYMVPAAFVTLDKFPQTPNGKIDRKALPAPDSPTFVGEGLFVAPQDALESQLVQIWQDVLKLPAISTTANYFEMGGHSLQAVKLFADIEKRLKLRLPVSLLFEAPTIRQLATAVRQRQEAAKWSSLVPIQPLGSKTPLFCVHGGAGRVFHYHDLAQLLGTERPFYGIQPKTDPTTHQAIYQTVEEMAAHYIREIKMVQPTGPYLLSGFCFGGIVVYEMALQLTGAGDEVGLLVFIDPTTPSNKPQLQPPPPPEELDARLRRHKKNMAQLGMLPRLGYILNSGKNRFVAYWHLFYRAWLRDWRKIRGKVLCLYLSWRSNVPSRLTDFYFMNVISEPATHAYHPKQYPGEAVLFFSTLENGGDESLGWSGLPEDDLILHKVESTHLGILKRPYIDQVAAKLKEHLEPFA
ncbi:amino acid adenylation domain-containing protein [Candidatus Leptofilum sp.]|uniref:non-ribosomal peptide synthetase n=1 Tax=Candidatus Leptofilum sp. TaxID=3241576 RepID=UPI003B5B9226